MMLAFVEDMENTTSGCLEDDTTIISDTSMQGIPLAVLQRLCKVSSIGDFRVRYIGTFSLAVEAGLFLSTQVGYLLFFFSVSTWITITAFYPDIGSLLFQEETYTAEIPGPSCSKRR